MTHGEKAEQLFLEGYNCAQSVFIAFEDLTGFPRELSARLSSSFGGGMGRMREVCGALTGAYMVLGVLYGYESPLAGEEKKAHYSRIQEFTQSFREIYGTILCRDLLENADTLPTPQKRTPEYYKERPCLKIVGTSADLLEKYVQAHPVND